MSNSIKHFSEYISPKTVGIIWLTDDKLNFKSPGVYEFNYLLDGMLVQAIDTQVKNSSFQKSNFFLGENFGKPIFVGHIQFSQKEDMKALDSHFEMASSFLEANAEIFIFNRAQNTANLNILKELSKKYKDYQFNNLNI